MNVRYPDRRSLGRERNSVELPTARRFRFVRLKRLLLTFVLATALAAVEAERRPLARPSPIVMLASGEPPRFPRLRRPYRAHYRRGGA